MADRDRDGAGMDRREFVRRSTLGAIGAGLAAESAGRVTAQEAEEGEAEEPAIPRRVLGRTELQVSEISFGSYGFENSDLLSAAIDAGMDLVDTGPSYQEGTAERAIGNDSRREIPADLRQSEAMQSLRQQQAHVLSEEKERRRIDIENAARINRELEQPRRPDSEGESR